jgi:stalled ribosome rescue protein Dom34
MRMGKAHYEVDLQDSKQVTHESKTVQTVDDILQADKPFESRSPEERLKRWSKLCSKAANTRCEVHISTEEEVKEEMEKWDPKKL